MVAYFLAYMCMASYPLLDECKGLGEGTVCHKRKCVWLGYDGFPLWKYKFMFEFVISVASVDVHVYIHVVGLR